MEQLEYIQAILLGFIQGATEFLPVSSSGHLAITQEWLDFDPESPAMLLFDVLAHLGTVLAVLIVFANSIRLYSKRLIAESRPGWTKRRYAWRIALLGIAASVPTAIIGLAFKDTFESAFGSKTAIGCFLMVTGLLLVGTMWFKRTKRGWKDFHGWRAVLVGVAQAMAILPGISRSGSTICTATFLGLRRRWAGEFSFFIAVPAVLGASAIKLKDTLELSKEQLDAIPWEPVLVGAAVSFVVGVIALKILLGLVRRAKLHYFAAYCWLLGILLIAGVL